MNDHAVLEWLNENELRSYPLQATGGRIIPGGQELSRCILDASLVYQEPVSTDQVTLNSCVVTVGGDLVVKVHNLPPFTVPGYRNQQYPFYCRNFSSYSWHHGAFGAPDNYAPQSSLLVFGSATASITGSAAFTEVFFEPCCVVDLSGPLQGVAGLRISVPLPVFHASPGGADADYGGDAPALPPVEGAVTHAGRVVWQEGYQFGLRAAGQTINMTAARNQGLSISCQNYFPHLRQDCDTIVSSINGVAPTTNPGALTIKAGPHVRVFDDPGNNRIYVGLDFAIADVCHPPLTPPKPA